MVQFLTVALNGFVGERFGSGTVGGQTEKVWEGDALFVDFAHRAVPECRKLPGPVQPFDDRRAANAGLVVQKRNQQ
jgi:hypothetical protein